MTVDPNDDKTPAPYTQQHRCWAQEVISAHIGGLARVRDALLEEYCGDAAMLACFLDFFYASVVTGSPTTAQRRFNFLQWMLGDVLCEFSAVGSDDPHTMAFDLASEDVAAQLPPALALSVRAAQTTLVSHMLARSGRQPWGIETTLSGEGLSQLTAGVHILLWMLCFAVRDELGDAHIIRSLLPHLSQILQLEADARGVTLDAFTRQLWLLHLQIDANLLDLRD